MHIEFCLAEKVMNFLKSSDYGEFLDTFGDFDAENLGAIDAIMNNRNGMINMWLEKVGTPNALALIDQINNQ